MRRGAVQPRTRRAAPARRGAAWIPRHGRHRRHPIRRLRTPPIREVASRGLPRCCALPPPPHVTRAAPRLPPVQWRCRRSEEESWEALSAPRFGAAPCPQDPNALVELLLNGAGAGGLGGCSLLHAGVRPCPRIRPRRAAVGRLLAFTRVLGLAFDLLLDARRSRSHNFSAARKVLTVWSAIQCSLFFLSFDLESASRFCICCCSNR
jgi:hypothetical protein